MTSNYYGGQHVTMHGGHHNTGISNNASPDPQEALRELISVVNELRTQVSPPDRQVIDASLTTIGTGTNVDRQPLRRALGDIAGIATVVGHVGAPVIEAVRKVMAALGL